MTKIVVSSGDDIGREIVAEAVKALKMLDEPSEVEFTPVGSMGYEVRDHPPPEDTLKFTKETDAILSGTVSDWKYDTPMRELRPERVILSLCKYLQLFTGFRLAVCHPELTDTSSPKLEIVADLDILIVRELNSDIYFDQPHGACVAPGGLFTGVREGSDTTRYAEPGIRRIVYVAFQTAAKRDKKLCSVSKASVFKTFQFWRDIVTDIHKEYPKVELSHMYMDNTATQFVKTLRNFDVVVTDNVSGDILSDETTMPTGPIGVLPSTSLDVSDKGSYKSSHGSAPDIADKGIANPLATILSAVMTLHYSLNKAEQANHTENVVKKVLAQSYHTDDILTPDCKQAGTVEMGGAVAVAL